MPQFGTFFLKKKTRTPNLYTLGLESWPLKWIRNLLLASDQRGFVTSQSFWENSPFQLFQFRYFEFKFSALNPNGGRKMNLLENGPWILDLWIQNLWQPCIHLALRFEVLAFHCMKHASREFQHAFYIYLFSYICGRLTDNLNPQVLLLNVNLRIN